MLVMKDYTISEKRKILFVQDSQEKISGLDYKNMTDQEIINDWEKSEFDSLPDELLQDFLSEFQGWD